MKLAYSKVRLGEVLKLDLDRVAVDPAMTYPMVGVLSFGRGLFERESIANGRTSYRVFYCLKPDHVVMSQLFAWEGALALSEPRFAGKFLSPQFPTFLCDPDRLDRDFLGWFMRRRGFWEDLATRASGMGDRRRTLTPEGLLTCEMPLPPLAEQRRIVARLEELATQINEACHLRKGAVEETKVLPQTRAESTYRRLLDRFGSRRLADCCESITDGDHMTPPFADKGVRFVFVGNVSSGHLHLDNTRRVDESYFNALSPQRIPHRGDILYTAVGATLGVPALVDIDEPFCFQRHVAILKPNRSLADSSFVWHMLRSRTIFEKAWASTTGSAQPTIPLRAIRELPVPVPPLANQRGIAAELDALQTEEDRVRRLQGETASQLAALLPAVLDRAFKGEL